MGLAAEPKQDAAGLLDCGRTKPGAVSLRDCRWLVESRTAGS